MSIAIRMSLGERGGIAIEPRERERVEIGLGRVRIESREDGE